jgi:tetratricopeptide (TPR) repeat protein
MKTETVIYLRNYLLKCTAGFFFLVLFSGCSRPGDMTVQRAMKAYSAREYDAALELFQQALQEPSHYSPELLYTFIGTVYSQKEDFPQSVVYQEKALAIRPDYRGYVTLGSTYHLIKDDDKAERAFRKAIAADGKRAEAYASLGSLYLDTARPEEAVTLLEKAESIAPNLAIIPANLSLAYAETRQFDKSDAAYERAVQLKCENIGTIGDKIKAIKSQTNE